MNRDPNFRTPGHIIEAAAEAALGGATGYAPGGGLSELREAIVDKVFARNGLAASPEQLCVTTGACGGLYMSLMLTVGPGDDVLVPDPVWSNYAAKLHVLGARMVPYPAGPAVGWVLDPAALESAVTGRTKVIMTGWRVGYVVGTREFIRQLSLHQEPVVSCASTISQHAALVADPELSGGQVRALCRRRRDPLPQSAGSRADPGRPGGQDGRGRTGVASRQDEDRVLQGQQPAGRVPHTEFTFLGFTFRPRGARNKYGVQFTSFLTAISRQALKKLSETVRSWRLHRCTGSTSAELAALINPVVRGWMNYYGRFFRSALYPLFRRISTYLLRWTMNKYKKLRT